jgi:hypothetical protein
MRSVVSAAREVADHIWWIPCCLEIGDHGVHAHNACYLVIGEKKTVLWDTSDPLAWRGGLDAALEGLLGGRSLDYIVPSHQEFPHSGNTRRLVAKYPDAMVVGDVRDYHVLFPNEADRLVATQPGTRLDLGGGDTLVLLPAIIKDLATTQWAYAERQQVLFSADAFAFSHHAPRPDDERPVHTPEECGLLASELDFVPGPEQVVWITRAALYWARFIPIDYHLPAFEQLLRDHPTRMVAPAHGCVIDDMALISVIWEAIKLAYDPEGAVAAAAAPINIGSA